MGNLTNDRRAAKAALRRREALELRKAGKNYEEISDALGYGSSSNARKAVLAAIRAIVEEPAEEVRKLELTRLDTLLGGLWTAASTGDLQAVDRALRIQDRRAAYLGLDAPKLLKLELERELSTHLARLKAALPSDVFEQVLTVLAGEHCAPPVGGASDDTPPAADDEGDQPGSA
jgi:hypothetical protein